MKKPLVIGITGDIGSGKSVICEVLSVLGYPVFDSDLEVKALYNEDEELRDFMVRHFGQRLYDTSSGLLNRKLLAEIIFSDSTALRLVEQKVHRLITGRFKCWKEKQTAQAIVLESAILFKTDLPALCDIFICVEAPLEERIERVLKRDNTSREAVMNRIDCQKSLPSYDGDKPLFRLRNSKDSPILPALFSITDFLNL